MFNSLAACRRERGDHDEDPTRVAMDLPRIGIGAPERRQHDQCTDDRRKRKNKRRRRSALGLAHLALSDSRFLRREARGDRREWAYCETENAPSLLPRVFIDPRHYSEPSGHQNQVFLVRPIFTPSVVVQGKCQS